MKLLLDQNLSPRLVKRLQEVFPGCAHVRDFELQSADDIDIWTFAIDEGFAIVSKEELLPHLAIPPVGACLAGEWLSRRRSFRLQGRLLRKKSINWWGRVKSYSKDSDFYQLAFAERPPQKVIRVQRRDCASSDIAELLHAARGAVERFLQEPGTAFLILE